MKEIKIIVIYKEGNNSDNVRLLDPFSEINGKTYAEEYIFKIDYKIFEETSKEDVINNYDILIYNWDINFTSEELKEIQKSVKIIYSLNQHFDFIPGDPTYKNKSDRYIVNHVIKERLYESDAIIVPTERLLFESFKYNDNVAVLPNFLNKEKEYPKKSPSDKLRIGILGDISNKPNWFTLKNMLNKCNKNKEIYENCEFIIAGYEDNNSDWLEVEKLFTFNKNLKVKTLYKTNDYMELYGEIDILLLPLVLHDYNLNKSALKLAECTVTKTIPLGSSLYSIKELKGIVVAEKPSQYIESIKKLLNKEYFNQVLDYIVKVNFEDMDFNKRIENTKSLLYTVYVDNFKPELNNVCIKAINGDTYSSLEEIINNCEKEYLAIINTDLSDFSEKRLIKNIRKSKYKDYDVINLIPNLPYVDSRSYLEDIYLNHPGLKELIKEVLYSVNCKYEYGEFFTIHNFLLMKKENWKTYYNIWLKPVLFMINNNEKYEKYKTQILDLLILFFVKQEKLKYSKFL